MLLIFRYYAQRHYYADYAPLFITLLLATLPADAIIFRLQRY